MIISITLYDNYKNITKTNSINDNSKDFKTVKRPKGSIKNSISLHTNYDNAACVYYNTTFISH